MCPLLVEGLHFACVEHAQCPLLAYCVSVRACTHTHTHTHTHVRAHQQTNQQTEPIIISLRRVDSSYTYHLRVNSMGFKDDASKTEAKTEDGPRVHPLFVRSPLFTCKEHAQHPLSRNQRGRSNWWCFFDSKGIIYQCICPSQ